MKIAIDINELTNLSPGGVKTYTREVVKALLEIDQDSEYFLYARKKAGGDTKFCAPASKNFYLKILKWPLPFWTYTRFAGEIKKQKPDILFMPIQSVPFLFSKPKKTKIIVTVHDLAFLKFPEHFTFKNRFLLNWHTRRTAKMADKIIVPSRATKNDLIDLCKIKADKIKVIYHGYNKIYPAASKDTKFCVSTNNYILFVGAIQPRKNIINLVKAFEIFKKNFKNPPNPLLQRGNLEFSPFKKGGLRGISDIKLVIVGGKGWLWRETFRRIEKSPVRKDIILAGAVGDQELADLYSHAEVFVLPSLYEGFGLPILEAFSYNVPVVTSDNSSLKEVAGDAGLLIDPNNPEEIAAAIKKVIENNDLRNSLIKKGKERLKNFSWEKSAREHLEMIKRC